MVVGGDNTSLGEPPVTFRGSFYHVIDTKGRIAIPGKWREGLSSREGGRLMLTGFVVGHTRCIDGYPYSQWERLEQQIMSKKRFSEAVFRFENYYISQAHDCVIDRQGRVLIPPPLRTYAGLRKDVVFTGALSRFRIWDAAAWEGVRAAVDQHIVDDPTFLEKLDL